MDENNSEKKEKGESETYALKAKRRWPKRIVKVLVVVIGIWWISHEGEISRNRNALEDEVLRLWKRGEPLRAADFDRRGIADEDNAALVLRAAAKSIQPSAAYEKFRCFDVRAPLDKREMVLMAQLLEENRDVLAQVRRARGMKNVNWPLPPGDSMGEMRNEDFLQQRLLADLLRAGIYLRHQQGNDAEAVELMRDVLGLIRVLHAAPGGVDEQLKAVSFWSKAVEIVFAMTAELKIGGSAQNAQGEGLRKLIDDLLDEKPMWDGARMAFQWERATALEAAQAAGRGEYGYRRDEFLEQWVLGVDRYLSRADVLHDATVWSQRQTRMLCAINMSDDLPGFENMTRRASEEAAQLRVMGRPIEHLVRPLYCTLTERRLGAVMLALKWYAAEHEGMRPRELAELTPIYLPAVPKDPFSGGGRAPGISVGEAAGDLQWSGIIGRMRGKAKKSRDYSGCDRWGCEDVVVRLDVEEWEKVWAAEERRAMVK